MEQKDIYSGFRWLEHQRIFFFGTFFIGSALILILKALGMHGAVVAATAVGLMFAYAVVGASRKLQVRIDVLGDNLYYIGFLFTLVSLSHSLYMLGTGRTEVSYLLENFGLAIATTLCGLALRVFFNQPKADISEYENAVRMSMTEAAAHFVGETSRIGRDISTVRTGLAQISNEMVESQKNFMEKLDGATNELLLGFKESVSQQQKTMSTAVKRIEISYEKLENSILFAADRLSTAANDSSQSLLSSVSETVVEIRRITEATRELVVFAHQANQEIERWGNGHSALLGTTTDIVDKLKVTTQLATEAASKFMAVSMSLSQQFTDLTAKSSKAGDVMEGTLLAANKRLNESAAAAGISVQNLNLVISQLNDSSKQLEIAALEMREGKTT